MRVLARTSPHRGPCPSARHQAGTSPVPAHPTFPSCLRLPRDCSPPIGSADLLPVGLAPITTLSTRPSLPCGRVTQSAGDEISRLCPRTYLQRDELTKGGHGMSKPQAGGRQLGPVGLGAWGLGSKGPMGLQGLRRHSVFQNSRTVQGAPQERIPQTEGMPTEASVRGLGTAGGGWWPPRCRTPGRRLSAAVAFPGHPAGLGALCQPCLWGRLPRPSVVPLGHSLESQSAHRTHRHAGHHNQCPTGTVISQDAGAASVRDCFRAK
ncbi:uncharacterized protein LOC123592653 [Leopardus geoffroyi]|uniref:uncharacterized protein LOC123592653 n=1 Tax=Leopardus geoffroyi TaxID=46844 RepID=UPI001E260E20|nr:uncharacterized protein LOC123592653 [Leopardus geoffroyi]